MVASVTAPNASRVVSVECSEPAETRAPIKVMPEMALLPDISGVCRVGGTLLMSSTPRNTASTKSVKAKIRVMTRFFS